MATITPAQMRIIEAINRYTFLTVPLIDMLQIHKNKVSIYRSLQALKNRSKPLIHVQNFGVHPTKGQLPSLIYLSKYAKELLLDCGYIEKEINIVSNKTFVSTDYFHRINNILVHVSIDLYLKSLEDAQLIFTDYYFSKVSSSTQQYARAKNRIDLEDENYFIPDLITKFRVEKKIYLYLIEIHNGTNANKAFHQCLNHVKAINIGTPKKKYQHPTNNRVVFIFEHASTMQSVMKRMNANQDLHKYVKLFLFKTIADIKEGFATNWFTFNGEIVDFM